MELNIQSFNKAMRYCMNYDDGKDIRDWQVETKGGKTTVMEADLCALSKKHNITFCLSGEHEYITPGEKVYCVKLKVAADGKVKVVSHFDRKEFGLFFEPVKKSNVFATYRGEDAMLVCNSKGLIYKMNYEEVEAAMEDMNPVIYLPPCDHPDELYRTLRAFYDKADFIKGITAYGPGKSFINYYTCAHDSRQGIHLFRQITGKYLPRPEEIRKSEEVALKKANFGGLRISTKKPILETDWDIDVNRMYPTYSQHPDLKVPMTAAVEAIKTDAEWAAYTCYPIGIYHVVVMGKHLLFANDETPRYLTHYDLERAKLCGIAHSSIQLVQDGQPNTFCYPSQTCARGNVVFGPFMNYLGKLEANIMEDAKTEEKRRLHLAWLKMFKVKLFGMLGKTVATRKRVECPAKLAELEFDEILESAPINSTGGREIKFIDKSAAYYRYPYARWNVFLVAFCRLQMAKHLLHEAINLADIKYLHTDGFITGAAAPYPHLIYSTKPGDWKVQTVAEKKRKRELEEEASSNKKMKTK